MALSGKKTDKKSRIQSRYESLEKQYKDSLGSSRMSARLDENKDMLGKIFRNCSDFVLRELKLADSGVEFLVACIDNLVNKESLNRFLLEPLMSEEASHILKGFSTADDLFRRLKESLVFVDNMEEAGSLRAVVEKIMKGGCVLLVEGCDAALVMNMSEWKGRRASEGIIERVVMGPQEAFVENVDINLSLLRNRLRTPEMKTERFEIGRLSKTSVVVAYVNGVADDKTVNEVRKRIQRIDIDIIADSSYIDKLIMDNTLSPFPQILSTERPDKTTASLAEGRIAIVVDGATDVLVVPVTLSDFLASAEDQYNLFYFATFFSVLRYFAFILALTGPSLYIAITTFHQEMIPLPLLITIARSRAEIPFPAIVEALLMEITFELLREAGIRLPQPVGPAISIVGGLVIGQGVVQAGIVSQTMVIVVAATGIASFSIPAFKFSTAVRIIRFPMMILAAFLGIFGIIMGLMVLLIHLVDLRSFGVPYLSPFTPFSAGGLKDTIVRAPLWSLVSRPSYIHIKNRYRMKKGLKPEPGNQE